MQNKKLSACCLTLEEVRRFCFWYQVSLELFQAGVWLRCLIWDKRLPSSGLTSKIFVGLNPNRCLAGDKGWTLHQLCVHGDSANCSHRELMNSSYNKSLVEKKKKTSPGCCQDCHCRHVQDSNFNLWDIQLLDIHMLLKIFSQFSSLHRAKTCTACPRS